jgi:transcriptional regulator with XRE-family HTH domain
MKRALLFLMIFFVSFSMNSQNPNRSAMLKQRIAQAKLQEIRKSLNLDMATFAQFRPIYMNYEREITRIDFKNQTRLMRVETDSLSAEEADFLITTQFKNSRKLINIREKYYKEFRTVLSPQQIIKLFQAEAELRNKVIAESKRRALNRWKGN